MPNLLGTYEPKIWFTNNMNGENVENLRCKVCTTYKHKINGMLRYNNSRVKCLTNYKTLNAVDHAKSDLHNEAIKCYYDELSKRQENASTKRSEYNISIGSSYVKTGKGIVKTKV